MTRIAPHVSGFTAYRCLLVLLIAVLVAGCTGLRLGYRHADTYFAWRVDSYFDLDALQKQDFNARLGRLLAWHRYEQLPEYAHFVNAAIKKGQSGLKPDDIRWFVEGVTARYRLLIERGIDDAVDMLVGISSAQIAELQKQWDKDNRDFIREHELEGSPAHRKHARLTRTLKQIREWTGHLAEEQEQKIEALLESIPLSNHLRHQDRIRRQKEFLQLVATRTNRSEFQARLHAWLRDWEQGRAPEFARLSTEVYEKRVQFYIAVEKLLTPAQISTAWRRLEEYADDFNALSRSPGKSSRLGEDVTKLALSCLPDSHACLYP